MGGFDSGYEVCDARCEVAGLVGWIAGGQAPFYIARKPASARNGQTEDENAAEGGCAPLAVPARIEDP